MSDMLWYERDDVRVLDALRDVVRTVQRYPGHDLLDVVRLACPRAQQHVALAALVTAIQRALLVVCPPAKDGAACAIYTPEQAAQIAHPTLERHP